MKWFLFICGLNILLYLFIVVPMLKERIKKDEQEYEEWKKDWIDNQDL